MKPILLTLFAALQICTNSPLWAQDSAAVLKPDALRTYVAAFNGQRPDDTSVDLPSDGSITAIRNDQAAAWMERNVPLFECSDKDIEETYHFRWWAYRKHIWHTPAGFVVTEFLPKVGWSKLYNTINCPVGHQLYEGAGFVTPRSSMTTRSFTLARAAMPGARPNSIHSGSPTPSMPAIWSPVTNHLSRGYSMG